MLKNNINNMLSDFDTHKRDKQQLLRDCVEERLNKSLQTYYKELTESFNKIAYNSDIKLMRQLNKVK